MKVPSKNTLIRSDIMPKNLFDMVPEVICTCGACHEEDDVKYCAECGEVVCDECLVMGHYSDHLCADCADILAEASIDEYSDIEPSEDIMYLMLDNVSYSLPFPSEELAIATSPYNGYQNKTFLDIEGLGRFKFRYRTIYEYKNNLGYYAGDLYTLYFEKVSA
jgi:hypothetical protein